MGNWNKLSIKNQLNLCRAEIKDVPETDKSLRALEALIEKYGLVDYLVFDEVHPVAYVLNEGNIRTNWNNPDNRKRFFNKYSLQNPKLLRYPLIDHAEYFRDGEYKAYLVSHAYQNPAEIEAAVAEIRKEKGYEQLKYDILDSSYYSDKTRCIVFYF